VEVVDQRYAAGIDDLAAAGFVVPNPEAAVL
jgi:hypothetical protein